MSTIKSICVYCASGPGKNPAFMQAAKQFGRILAENGIRLVYGGGFDASATGASYRAYREKVASYLTDLSADDQAKVLAAFDALAERIQADHPEVDLSFEMKLWLEAAETSPDSAIASA